MRGSQARVTELWTMVQIRTVPPVLVDHLKVLEMGKFSILITAQLLSDIVLKSLLICLISYVVGWKTRAEVKFSVMLAAT